VSAPKSATRLSRAALLALLLVPAGLCLLLPHAPRCFSMTVVGLPCPGCGLGRALLDLGRLELRSALVGYPPLLPLAAGYLLALVLVARGAVGRRIGARGWRLVTLVGGAASVVVVCNWIFQLSRGVSP